MKTIRRFLVILLLLLPCASYADTITSSPIRLMTETTETTEDLTDRPSSGSGSSLVINYTSSGSESISIPWSGQTNVSYYVITIRDANGKTVDSDRIKSDVEWYYDGDKIVSKVKTSYTYQTQLHAGLYTVSILGYTGSGDAVFDQEMYLCFNSNASIVVTQGERSGTTFEATRSMREFSWYPVVDWSSMKSLSTRYRFRITDDSVDQKKEFWKSIVYEETTNSRHVSVEGSKLPVGVYTIKVWAYDASGNVLEIDILHLTVRYRSTIYNFNLIEDLDITPGEALTRQHAVGSKDMSLYGTVKVADIPQTPMTALTVDGETLEIRNPNRFTASVTGKTLVLYSGTGTWRVSQKALSVLNKSGIETLRLSDPTGSTDLATDLTFSGRVYGELRSQGYVSKDFILAVEENRIRVECGGVQYDYSDGVLQKEEAGGEEV